MSEQLHYCVRKISGTLSALRCALDSGVFILVCPVGSLVCGAHQSPQSRGTRRSSTPPGSFRVEELHQPPTTAQAFSLASFVRGKASQSGSLSGGERTRLPRPQHCRIITTRRHWSNLPRETVLFNPPIARCFWPHFNTLHHGIRSHCCNCQKVPSSYCDFYPRSKKNSATDYQTITARQRRANVDR
ncbi:hypothetical protein VTK26DRAFT_787 [Humicola hyalothermophila]